MCVILEDVRVKVCFSLKFHMCVLDQNVRGCVSNKCLCVCIYDESELDDAAVATRVTVWNAEAQSPTAIISCDVRPECGHIY